jgi:hypothetical protein
MDVRKSRQQHSYYVVRDRGGRTASDADSQRSADRGNYFDAGIWRDCNSRAGQSHRGATNRDGRCADSGRDHNQRSLNGDANGDSDAISARGQRNTDRDTDANCHGRIRHAASDAVAGSD